MSLPKDEWRLLAGYYCTIKEIGTRRPLNNFNLGKLLQCFRWSLRIPDDGDEPLSNSQTAGAEYLGRMERAKVANQHLANRGLITLENQDNSLETLTVSLTVDGYDLGRMYSCWFSRSGLQFAQYKDHWLWLAVAFIGGGIVSNIIDRFFER